MRIIEYFCEVTDKRKLQGRRYNICSILGLLLLSRLCGHQGIKAAWRLGLRLSLKQRTQLNFNNKIPSYQGMLYILQHVDIDSFEDILGKIVRLECGNNIKAARLVSLDGKRLRGSFSNEEEAVHLVSAFCYRLCGVYGQVRSGYGGGEIAAALELLDKLPLAGMIITGDAAFANRDICQKIVAGGGDYVFTVKDNQERLKREIELAFTKAETSAITTYSEELTKQHGRVEQRSIRVTDMPWEYNDGWATIKQVACITRYRWQKGSDEDPFETVYAIASMPKKSASPAQILACNRGHWAIENRLHRTRDTLFDEDRNRLRTADTPQINAAISNLVIFLCKRSRQSVTAATQAFANNLKYPLQLIGEIF
jgi:predicted transposase YbfD/YdcC